MEERAVRAIISKRVLYASVMIALAGSGQALAADTSNNNHARSPEPSSRQASAKDTSDADNTQHPKKAENLKAVNVTGILKSQMRAIELKRTAPNIQDSITSVDIGELPDVTIADSLQRITGVQVGRNAGEGTTINIRGLPEVTTLINGESFITASNIYSIQPNYQTLPSSLFSGADVVKSPTADMLTSGISGTVDLKTRRPWDLPFGWTTAGSLEAGRGQVADKTKPDGNLLVGYNSHGNWGFLVGASYSDFVHSSDVQGWQPDQTGRVAGENASSANADGLGYLTGWSGSPIPSQIKPFADGSVDVNGDGTSDGAFYSPPRFKPTQDTVQPKRTGLNAAFQYGFDNGLTFTADGFFNHQVQTDESIGVYTLPVSQTSPTSLPLASRGTGTIFTNPFNTAGEQDGDWNQQFYTVQKYNVVVGDSEPESTTIRTNSYARNFNTDLKFDNGGAFSGDLRWINASASQQSDQMTIDLSDGDGSQWPNVLKPGVSLPSTVYVHPANEGGNYAFNPNGFPQYAYGEMVDWSGKNPVVTVPSSIQSRLGQESTYVVKSIYGNGSKASTSMNVVRADGHYRFTPDFSLDFGARNSIRSASLNSYVFAAHKYAGNGASDPDGCLVRWTTSDIILNGGGIDGACTASNADGYFRGNELMGPISQLPGIISDHMMKISNVAETPGVVGWGVDPAAMAHPYQFYNATQGGTATRVTDPASSWDLQLKERTLYAQANFQGSIAGLPFSGNAGFRYIRTNLDVRQNLTGAARPYGLPQANAGAIRTHRQYTDILPAINVAIELTPKLKLRLAGSKNMMPLSLDQWGGGFSRSFQTTTLANGTAVQAVTGAASGGNPQLNPWRSENFGASLSYYMNRSSVISLAAFRIRVSSFIVQSSAIECDIPDQDGVVRRCVDVTEPVQGTGTTLHGLEANYSQSLDFLPGFLAHTGFQINGTYSPSDTGKKDLAGNAIPFPDNSKKSANLILYYQDAKLQARVAANYRGRRAVAENYAGIDGLEVYQKPTTYVDASVSYQFTPNFQIYVQAQNLTNERQQYYLVWPDEKYYANLSERYYMAGVRFHF